MRSFGRPTITIRVLLSLLSLVFCQVEATWASNFSITPIEVFLSAKTPSVLLTLRNQDVEMLRFQLNGFAWDQSPQGEMLLGPTEDIVFFPVLLTVAPGEERKIRIGRAVPIDSTEKTYRIFIEELPPLEKPQGSQGLTKVRVVTRVGIPIFIQPAKPVTEGRIQEMAIRGGLFSFQVKNTGNVHFVPGKLRVKGIGSEGEIILDQQTQGWYILAGGSRSYELELRKEDCVKIKDLAIEVETGETTLNEKFPITQSACGP